MAGHGLGRAFGLGVLLMIAACGAQDDTDAADAASDPGAAQTTAVDPAFAALAEANAAAGQAFLAQNAGLEGLITTDSGLQYTVAQQGAEGGSTAGPEQFVCVHYEGRKIDGTKFDSSYDRGMPALFPINGVIPGFAETLTLMRPGDIYEVVIPHGLAYGESGTPDGTIGPSETLLFRMELIEAMDRPAIRPGEDCGADKVLAEENLAAAEAFLAENAAREDVQTTDSGLQYRVVTPGDPEREPAIAGEHVCVHYRGTFMDGGEFDSSYSRNQAAAFPSDRVIQGWVEALSVMRPGAEWELFIHPELGYGRSGSGGAVGPNQALIFSVELIDVLAEGPPPPGVDCAAPVVDETP